MPMSRESFPSAESFPPTTVALPERPPVTVSAPSLPNSRASPVVETEMLSLPSPANAVGLPDVLKLIVSLPWLPNTRSLPNTSLTESLPKPPTWVSLPPASVSVSLPPLPNRMSPPVPPLIESAPSLKSLPPTRICAADGAGTQMVSAPSPPNSCIAPMAVPPSEDAVVLAAAVDRAGVAGTQDHAVVAAVAGNGGEARAGEDRSSPARPTMVPGPLSPDWFKVSLPAVPVAE